MRDIRGETHIERNGQRQRQRVHRIDGRIHTIASIAQTSRTDVQNVNGANWPTHTTMGVIDNDDETTMDGDGHMRDDGNRIVRVYTGDVHGW